MNPRVAHLALLAGLAALVPIPLLDGWLARRAHRAIYAHVGSSRGRALDDSTLDALSNDRSSLVAGCLSLVLLWPLKKLFRTVFYFLTIKDVIDWAAEASVRAAMVHAALPHLPHDAERVRGTMEATLGRWHLSPLTRTVMRGPRPDGEWLTDGHAAGRAVRWVYVRAGGHAIVADFSQRLGGS